MSVCGKIFWYKDPFRAFLISTCGVPTETGMIGILTNQSLRSLGTYFQTSIEWVTMVFNRTKNRYGAVQVRNIPDDNVPDKNAAIDALRWLKKLAAEQKLVAEKEQSESEAKVNEARRRQLALAARAQRMEQLRSEFAAMSMATSAEEVQRRGYDLEELFAQLFEAHEINYRRPYRVKNEQIDGYFGVQGL